MLNASCELSVSTSVTITSHAAHSSPAELVGGPAHGSVHCAVSDTTQSAHVAVKVTSVAASPSQISLGPSQVDGSGESLITKVI